MSVSVKICGITTEAALETAIEAGADYIGLVFYEKSPRHLDIVAAAALAERARGKVRIVSLLVSPSDAMIKQVVQGVGPALIQLHSNESPERVGEVQELSGLPVIKAVRIGTQADAADAERYAGVAQLVLFDAKPGAQANSLPGGNGAKFDWRLIAAWKGRSDFMLSGGLNPDNVGVAIAETHAAAVDVSSGVESAPGIKSPQLIRRFIAAARSENSSADQQG